MFREVSEDDLAEAARIARNVRTPRTDMNSSSAAREIIASGAALALEKGAPRLLSRDTDLSAEEFFHQGTYAALRFQHALARALGKEEDVRMPEPAGPIRQVVADVMQQVSAARISRAVDNDAFADSLNPAQVEMVQVARKDPAFRSDLAAIRSGSFERLSPGMAEALSEALTMPLGQEVDSAIEESARLAGRLIDREAKIAGQNAQQSSFRPFSEKDLAASTQYLEAGVTTGIPRVDGALTLAIGLASSLADRGSESPLVVAGARLIANYQGARDKSAAEMAIFAISDARIIQSARQQVRSSLEEDGQLGLLSNGRYEHLASDTQKRLHSQFSKGLNMTPLEKMRIEARDWSANADRAKDRSNDLAAAAIIQLQQQPER